MTGNFQHRPVHRRGTIALSVAVLLSVLEGTGRIPIYKISGIYTVTLLGVIFGTVLFLWVEKGVWSVIRKAGTKVDQVVHREDFWLVVDDHGQTTHDSLTEQGP